MQWKIGELIERHDSDYGMFEGFATDKSGNEYTADIWGFISNFSIEDIDNVELIHKVI